MKIILTIFAALLSVTASSSLIIDAEARGADEPCSYLHPSWSINPNTGIVIKEMIEDKEENLVRNAKTNQIIIM